MITTVKNLAKRTGVSYNTLQVFIDRHNLLIAGSKIQKVDYNSDFRLLFRNWVKNRRCPTPPMLRLGGLL